MKILYKFKDFVFTDKNYVPHFDEYKDHLFQITHQHPDDPSGEHVWLTCVDNCMIKVKGYVETYMIEPADKVLNKSMQKNLYDYTHRYTDEAQALDTELTEILEHEMEWIDVD